MAPAHDFKLALTRVIEPTGGPGAELATLEDAARFIGLMRPWRQAWPHWDYAAELVLIAATTGEDADIERATAQIVTMPHGSYSLGETAVKTEDGAPCVPQVRQTRAIPDSAGPDWLHLASYWKASEKCQPARYF